MVVFHRAGLLLTICWAVLMDFSLQKKLILNLVLHVLLIPPPNEARKGQPSSDLISQTAIFVHVPQELFAFSDQQLDNKLVVIITLKGKH